LTIATLNRFFLMVSTAIVFIGITGIIMMQSYNHSITVN
jgi:cytochrome b subunit of formate dehydrogenase